MICIFMTLLGATTSETGIVYPSRAHRHEVTAGILVPLSFFFWLLHCLSFSEIRLLITHLISSNCC
jgi:hypothetical protein